MATATASATAGYELNLDEYWQIIRRRRWIILFCALSLGVFSWLFTWLNQPVALYESETAVKVERSSDLTGLLLRSVTFSKTDNMSTQMAMIESFTLMERVAKSMGLIPKDLTSEEVRANLDFMGKILSLKNAVEAEQDGNSSIINIMTTSTSPEFARDFAQAVADEYRAFNSDERNRRVVDAKIFIQEQLVVVGGRLKQAEETLRLYREKNDITNVGAGSTIMASVVTSLEQEFRKSMTHLNDLKFTLFQLRERVQMPTWNYQAITAPAQISAYFDELNGRLVQMALLRTKLSTNYTDNHPQIIELRDQAKDILHGLVVEVEKQVELTNRRIQDVQINIENAERRFKGLPEQMLELQRLGRAVRVNEGLFNQLEEKYQEVLIKEAEKVQEVTLVRPAFLSTKRINPVRAFQTAFAGFVLGLVLGLIISLLMEAMDTSIGTIEEVESFLEVPVMGFVPHLSHEEAHELFSGESGLATSGYKLERQIRLITHFSPPATISEAYRSLRTNLLFSQAGGRQAIMVTSATVKEGKSTIAANLAVVVAQQGARVLLVDSDLRKPIMHKTFGLSREPGLAEYLLGQYVWQDVTRRFSDIMLGEMGVDEALYTPGLDQLDIITCGHSILNPPDLLGAKAMDILIEEARQEYDLVLFDTPPMLHTTDATVLGSKVDGVLLVYHIGAVVRGALKRVKSGIESVGGKVIGLVLNGVRGELSSDFTKYKMDRYYAYTYGSEESAAKPASATSRLVSTAKEAFMDISDRLAGLLRRGKGGNDAA